MKRLDFSTTDKSARAIALGFFDCIHLGHASLIRQTVELAAKLEAASAVFTFSNDPNAHFGKSKQIYTFEERCEAIEALGAASVISAEIDDTLSSLSAEDFLAELFERFNVKAIAAGKDYTFGKDGAGDVRLLTEFAKKRGAEVKICDFVLENGSKLSTGELKTFVNEGNIRALNCRLSQPYFMLGHVTHGRGVGAKIGFPTANLAVGNRLMPKDGIYATLAEVDGKSYPSMTNIGARPTFSNEERAVEVNIFDFNEDIYGKDLKLTFLDRTRDVLTFPSVDELVAQLSRDRAQIKDILGDLKA